MEPITEFIYYFIAFALGVTLNIFLVMMCFTYKNVFLRLFTAAYLLTSLLVLYYLVNNFLLMNGQYEAVKNLAIVEAGLMSLIIWTVTLLVLRLFYDHKSASIIAAIILGLVPLVVFGLRTVGILSISRASDIYYIFFILILIISCVIFLRKYRKIQHLSFRKFGIILASVLTFFLVWFIIQTYVSAIKLDAFPLFYLFITVQVIIFFWKNFFREGLDSIFNINERFIEKYHITKREQEIIALIQNGCSNLEISRKLFVSEKTAANHIYNIYKKLNISSRFELICLFKK